MSITDSASSIQDNLNSKPSPTSNSIFAIVHRFETVIVACLMLCAFLPMGYIHFWQVLKKTHYQFVIYLPILMVLLCFKETVPQLRIRIQPGNVVMILMLMFVCCLLTMVSVWKWSPWLNYATCLMSTGLFAYWQQGKTGVVRVFPFLLLAVCALPLPFALDDFVTAWLKNVATDCCSIILDRIGIYNLTYKNVIELSGKELFVADACSGIHSLFVMTTGAVFISLWNSRGPLQLVSLLLITIGLVMIENVARLTIVSYAWTNGNDLTTGNPHKILGFLLFGVSLFFLWSFDNFLTFIFGNTNTTSRVYTNSIDAVPSKTSPQQTRALTPWGGMIYCSLVFPVMGLFQLANATQQINNLPAMIMQEYPLPEFKPEIMPDSLNGLKFIGQRQVKRVPEDPMGKTSQAWEYRKDGLFVRISLDYPYESPHDMCLCYYNTGWTINERNIVNVSNELSFTDATLTRPMFGNGYVAFVQFNQAGKYQFEQKSDSSVGINDTKAIKKGIWESIRNAFNRGNNSGGFQPINQGPWYQVHMIAISHEPMTPQLQEELRNLFKDNQGILVKECLKYLPQNKDN